MGGTGERLESIRDAHRSHRDGLSSRMEDYLEVISELVSLKGYATTLDISGYMGVSAPSVTKMLQRLDDAGCLKYEKYKGLRLTRRGAQVAGGIRQRHGTLLEFLEMIGVDPGVAARDVEGIEHHLNRETAARLREFVAYMRSDPAVLAGFRRRAEG